MAILVVALAESSKENIDFIKATSLDGGKFLLVVCSCCFSATV